MFRHILNFLRTDRLSLPVDYKELDVLIEEANFYGIAALIQALAEHKEHMSRPARCVVDWHHCEYCRRRVGSTAQC